MTDKSSDIIDVRRDDETGGGADRVVVRYFELITDADAASFVSLFAVDAEMHDPVGTPAHRGHAGIAAFHKGLHRAWKTLAMSVEGVHVRGNHAAATWKASGLSATGKQITFGGIDVFHLDDGKITRLEGYWDLENVIARM